jgi:hypothetical protein
MKKLLLLSIACLTFTVLAYAQEVVIKPTVGINFTNFSKDPTTGTYKSQVGYQIGGSVSFGEKFYVEPGVFYAKKSTDYTYSNAGSNTSTNFQKDITLIDIGETRSIYINLGVRIPMGGK